MTGREQALEIFRAALTGVEPRRATAAVLTVERGVLRFDGREVARRTPDGRLVLLAAGKAAVGMARSAVEILGDPVVDGIVAVPHAMVEPVGRLTVFGAGHPLPDAGSLAAAGESLRLARSLGEGDVLLCLLSGGASALWSAPPAGVTLDDLRQLGSTLMAAGADIGELNMVRRQLSTLAGGRLAAAARPARVVTLAISDVSGAPPEVIGSGPTLAGTGGYEEALEVITRRGARLPSAVIRHLQRGMAGQPDERLAGGADGDHFHVIADLQDALHAGRAAAERLGLRAEIISGSLAGEARAAGAEIASIALRALRTGGGPRALIWGGETTVTVRGSGRGGRCQELAIAAARLLGDQERITVLACGTDGIDGPTPAAGALVDGGTIARARGEGFDPDAALAANDSHPLLRAAGDLVMTGSTGTNVGDVVVAVID